MNREEVHKLLGGYATGTLTPEEQQALFAAALDDQELFDSLAREQSLRDLLRDPSAKAQLLAALDSVRLPWYQRGWWRPAAVAVAMAGIAAMVVVVTHKPAPAPQTAILADAKESKALTTPRVERRAEKAAKTAVEEIKSPAAKVDQVPEQARQADEKLQSTLKEFSALQKEDTAAPKDLPAPPTPPAAPVPAPEPPAVVATTGQQAAAPAPVAVRSSNQAIGVQATPSPYFQAQQQLGFRDAAGSAGAVGGGGSATQNARLLFYGNPSATGAISGRVADPQNAAIPGVKVTAVQAGTDARFEASTDRNGMYTIPFLPGATYRISAEAPGFKRYARDNVIAGANGRLSFDIMLEVGAVSETVEVTGAAPDVPTISTSKSSKKTAAPERLRAVNAIVPAAKPAAVPNFRMGVRYSIVRQPAGGEPVEVGVETPLNAGEQVKLKIVPNDRGYLRVWESSAGGGLRSVADGPTQPMQAFEASLPEYPSPGTRQFYVQFTRDSQPPPSLLKPTDNLVQNMADGAEKATYVVTRVSDPAAQQLIVPITLTYR